MRRFLDIIAAITLIFLLIYPAVGRADEIEDAKAAASASGNAAQSYSGTVEQFKSNLVSPLTSGDKPMTTLDGQTQFSGQVSCPSSSKFIEVIVQPGGSGDLNLVRVSQDTLLKGQTDYIYSVPVIVSGVCSNGLISCDPGTWSGCRYFKWIVNDEGHVQLAETDFGNLSGCYCLNNYCGSGLVWSNLDVVLRNIGGGVSSAILSRSGNRYTITDAKTDGPFIRYYGQDVKNCSQIGAGGTSPAQYYSPQSDSALLSATDAEIQAQAQDPTSLYSLVITSPALAETGGEPRTCRIERKITVDKILTCPAGGTLDQGTQTCIIPANDYTPQTFATGGGYSGCYFSFSISPSGGDSYGIGNHLCGDPQGGIVKKARVIYRCGGQQHIIYSAEYQAVTFPSCPSGDAQFVQGFYYTAPAGTIDCSYYPGSSPLAETACSSPPNKEDQVIEGVNNGCAAIEADPACKLMEEQVDSVYTYRNYSPTKLVPVASCRSFSGFIDHNVCRDWWLKDRTYFCKSTSNYDFTDLKTRTDAIAGSVTGNPTAGDYRFRDITKSVTGSWTTTEYDLGANTLRAGSPESCEMACKTRKIRVDAQASMAGVTSDYRKDNASYDFFYRRCAENTCPAGDGEEIVKDCQCVNDFAEAATALTLMDNASNDIICTSGKKY